MRKAKIYYEDRFAGILTETNEGEFIFRYDDQYVKKHPNDFITFSMPVSSMPFHQNGLFAFFEGLIPEGWLLDIASKSWKINQNDRMGLLLTCCRNCIGAVSVVPLTEENEI